MLSVRSHGGEDRYSEHMGSRPMAREYTCDSIYQLHASNKTPAGLSTSYISFYRMLNIHIFYLYRSLLGILRLPFSCFQRWICRRWAVLQLKKAWSRLWRAILAPDRLLCRPFSLKNLSKIPPQKRDSRQLWSRGRKITITELIGRSELNTAQSSKQSELADEFCSYCQNSCLTSTSEVVMANYWVKRTYSLYSNLILKHTLCLSIYNRYYIIYINVNSDMCNRFLKKTNRNLSYFLF